MRAVLFLLPIALVLAACGGDVVSLDPVAKAADSTSKQGSEHVEFTASVGAAGRLVSMTGSGDFSNDPQLGQMTLRFTTGATSYEMREVINNWTVYMSSPLFARALPSGKQWLSLDLKKAGKAAGIDLGSLTTQTPTGTLAQLRASGNVVEVGREAIDGVATTHYTATIDMSKIPNSARIKQLTNATYKPVDVWVDAARLVRRIHLAYSATVGASATATDMTMSFSNYGESVNVPVPSSDVTLDATDLASASLGTS
jgi:LppX_LprAFG lipoprotein